jgi:histidine triad (HIT) family protein
VVYETPTILAFRDIKPQAATHVLVVPREHHEDAVALASEAPSLLADVIRTAGEVAGREGAQPRRARSNGTRPQAPARWRCPHPATGERRVR